MFIPPEHIIPELKATERDAAIRELLEHLVQVGAVAAATQDSLLAGIQEREEVMSTGIGFGMALPHCSSNLVMERVIALGYSKNGIDLSGLDGQPAGIICLLVKPVAGHLPKGS